MSKSRYNGLKLVAIPGLAPLLRDLRICACSKRAKAATTSTTFSASTRTANPVRTPLSLVNTSRARSLHGGEMDSRDAQFLFKETRLNLEPTSSASVVNIRVPSGSANGRSQRKLAAEATFEDETTFRLKNLATASSVYHRKWHDSPTSFLWRVLEDGKVLSIRAIDVCKNDKTPDAPLILNLKFDATIQPGCVAFADPKEHDALAVHVLDTSSQLYTFTLRPDSFRKKSAVDAGLNGTAKVQAPTGLGFKQAHRMVAVSSELLVITSNDGGLIRFDKSGAHDQTKPLWTQRYFNVQGWAQNLRSLLPFQGKHTIQYGKVNMEYSAATSIDVTSFGLDDCLFAVTICLDHRMRIWNLDDGQIIYTGDILNAERTPQEVGKWSIDPSQSNLLRITGSHRGHRICATYSPVGAGEFKFWKIAAKDAHTVVVNDVLPQEKLYPVTPSSDVWTLADFVLASPDEGTTNLWTLWKNNLTYRVQRLELDNISRDWQQHWGAVYSETGLVTAENSGPCDSTDVTEKWLQMILQPGKFTKATLQTALSIYERGLGATKEGNQNRGLAESICSVLGSTASLDRGSTGAMDYEQFRASSEAQWRRFYRLLVELDRQRGEAIGLSLSPKDDMTWVVCTDMISAVRECSPLERLFHSLDAPGDDQGHLAPLVGSAITLVDGFSDHFIQLSNAALRPELFEESSKSDLERIEAFENKAGFWRGVTEEDCAQINDALGNNFDRVTDDLYTDILDLIAAPASTKEQSLHFPLTEFGRRLILQGAQENIELRWKVCFAQLILLAHMEFDFDTDEDQLHNRVDVGGVFKQLVDALRRLELLKWLAKTELALPQYAAERRGSMALPSKKGSDESQIVTALDMNVSHLLGFSDLRSDTLSANITDLVSNLCAPDSDIEILPSLVQCRLLKDDRPDLALGLAPFADQSAFSTYVQGRVFLSLKDFSSAALCFREASEGMSASTVRLERHSSGLLDDTEWNLLNNGQAKYYSHIVALYEKQRAYSYVIDFAKLAAHHFGSGRDASLQKIDMLSRLFNAAVATSQFELAHSSLQSFKDDALRHSSLRKLVDRMCESCHNHELVALSFPGMQQDVDDILAQRCKATMDVVQGSPYHQLLYSWRIKHNNYRGAATVLFDRIQKLRVAGEGDKIAGDDTLDTPVTKQYLLLINALTCVEPKQAWIYDESGLGEVEAKRRLVTLADVRKQYQDELDRIAAIQNNQFGFEADDVMEIS